MAVVLRERWFEIDTATLSSESNTVETGELVQIERVGTDFCGCCATGRRQERGGGWRGIDGEPRQQMGPAAWAGGVGFVLAIVAIVLLVLVVWSLDSFDDALGTAESGSGD
jgi:hypothetical protein